MSNISFNPGDVQGNPGDIPQKPHEWGVDQPENLIPIYLDRAYALARVTRIERIILQYIRVHSCIFTEDPTEAFRPCRIDRARLSLVFNSDPTIIARAIDLLVRDGMLVRSGKSYSIGIDPRRWSRNRLNAKGVAYAMSDSLPAEEGGDDARS